MRNKKNIRSILLLIVEKPLLLLLNIYQQFVSPLLGQNCKHYPSCSSFSKEAIIKHGPITGLILSVARILRCNPWSLGGYDPIPDKISYRSPKTFKIFGNYQTKLYQQKD